jgi:hypothetical protein
MIIQNEILKKIESDLNTNTQGITFVLGFLYKGGGTDFTFKQLIPNTYKLEKIQYVPCNVLDFAGNIQPSNIGIQSYILPIEFGIVTDNLEYKQLVKEALQEFQDKYSAKYNFTIEYTLGENNFKKYVNAGISPFGLPSPAVVVNGNTYSFTQSSVSISLSNKPVGNSVKYYMKLDSETADKYIELDTLDRQTVYSTARTSPPQANNGGITKSLNQASSSNFPLSFYDLQDTICNKLRDQFESDDSTKSKPNEKYTLKRTWQILDENDDLQTVTYEDTVIVVSGNVTPGVGAIPVFTVTFDRSGV